MVEKTVLVVDADAIWRQRLGQVFQSCGFRVLTAVATLDAILQATDKSLDAICIDVESVSEEAELLLSKMDPSRVPLVILVGDLEQSKASLGRSLLCHTVQRHDGTEREVQGIVERHVSGSSTTNESVNAVSSSDFQKSGIQSPSESNSQVDFLDSVFSLMAGEADILSDVIPAPRPWVLCIDDDYDFSILLAQRLESYDIGVINAYEGMGGVKTAFACPANAILLDYNMPNGCGDEVLARLKKSPVTRDIPVIVLTGNKDPGIRNRMLNGGAEALFYKPPSFELLIQELRRFIPIPADACASKQPS